MKLCFPEEILRQHLAVLGKTGAGKSSALRHIVEHLLQHNKRVCVIDPKGDWWGLKKSADGKGAGLPVIAFGDFRNPKATDVPINAHSGKHVAELVAGGNRPCIIGFGGWPTGQMVKFWIDFASALFALNSGELYLVGDEFHNFAPKGKIMDPEAGKCLHWSNRLMSEGRGCGLVCLIASQRPQKVHNDALTCCETLVAMRVTHKADRSAAQDWIEGCGDMEKGKEVLNSLAGMARGEAFVWSPEIGFGPKRITFPMFETFDSFAPPQLQKKISGETWASVDLEEVKVKLASVIEEQKANDPGVLKAEVRRLKGELEKAARVAEQEVRLQAAQMHKVEPAIKEVPVLMADELGKLEKLVERLSQFEGMGEDLQSIACRIEGVMGEAGTIRGILQQRLVKTEPPRTTLKPKPERLNRVQTAENGAARQHLPTVEGDLTGTQQKILDTVAMLGVRGLIPNREMIAKWLGIHPNGGRYGSDLAALRAASLLDGCELTMEGIKFTGASTTGLEAATRILDGTQQNIISVLANGGQFDRESLAEKLGIHPNGGRYGSDLARLRTMGLIPERGTIKLTEAAFR